MRSGQYKVSFGGWYQRTTLHLTEIYDLLASGSSELDLSKDKLKELHSALNLAEVCREVGYLEYVKAITRDGIEIRYYEDGLYVLEADADDVDSCHALLEKYYEEKLNPAISYIFSLGAPTPKILANIKTVHPTAVAITGNPADYQLDETKFGRAYNKMSAQGMAIFKTPDYIVVVSGSDKEELTKVLVETQIFFREFKDQLQKYLNIHRKLWEEISEIKDQKSIRGTQVELVRSRLDAYQKTISLISNRINQMGTYVGTRSSISKNFEVDEYLVKLFQFKFEALSDSLNYIKEIWKMTGDYLNSAIQNVIEIKSQSTARNIQSLQLITSLGVVAGIVGYLSRPEFPRVTVQGAIFFASIIIVTWLFNYLVIRVYRFKKYKINFGERASNI